MTLYIIISFFAKQGGNHYIAPLHNVHHFGGSGDAWKGYWCVGTPSVELLQGNNVFL